MVFVLGFITLIGCLYFFFLSLVLLFPSLKSELKSKEWVSTEGKRFSESGFGGNLVSAFPLLLISIVHILFWFFKILFESLMVLCFAF
jgi:hypothetical protein